MEEVLQFLDSGEGALSYLVLTLSAALEYVFPPFPGDTVTLFGAFLITAQGWNLWSVLATVTLGSLLGASLDYFIGVGLARKGGAPARSWLGRYWQRAHHKLVPLIERLRKRGASYIIVNRFLPGVRALFFVAAGMAGIPLRSVLFYATVSALAWNILIIAVGASIGASWERLRALFETYTTAVWAAMVLAAVLIIARWLYRRRKDGSDGENRQRRENDLPG